MGTERGRLELSFPDKTPPPPPDPRRGTAALYKTEDEQACT